MDYFPEFGFSQDSEERVPMRKDKRFQRLVFLQHENEAQAVRFSVTLSLLLVGILALPGCALFSKKPNDTKPATSGSGGGGSPPAKFPTSSDPLLNGGNASKGSVGGAVLAGRVIDNYSKPPVDTSIRLVSVDGKDAGPPVDVTVTPEGYFTIPNLQAGTNYKLVARGKNGEHLLAGITYTRAPNLTVVIQVREDFANAGTPDVLGSPALSDKKAKASSGDEPMMPSVNVPTPNSNAATGAPANQDWVAGPSVASDKGTFWPPPLDIPNPTAKPVPPPLQIPKTNPPPPPAAFELGFPTDDRLNGAARVPSCNLLGNQLVNFALNDVNGTDYEFKRNRRGKLVLLDFWATDCVYCVKNIPNLKNIQSKYGSGLEVIGIACEKGGSAQEQAIRVDKFAREKQINYRQLVSTSSYCPVREQFRVSALPTMYLIDQSGMIIWRHEGFLARDSQSELERLIQKQLR
jgi:thiol-disulfide isomerase/thioredoxin